MEGPRSPKTGVSLLEGTPGVVCLKGKARKKQQHILGVGAPLKERHAQSYRRPAFFFRKPPFCSAVPFNPHPPAAPRSPPPLQAVRLLGEAGQLGSARLPLAVARELDRALERKSRAMRRSSRLERGPWGWSDGSGQGGGGGEEGGRRGKEGRGAKGRRMMAAKMWQMRSLVAFC